VEQLEWQGGQVHSRSGTPGAPLYYSTVSKDSAQFSFEQHRQGKVYMPGTHEATNDTYGTYTPALPQHQGRGGTQIRGQTDDILRYHTSAHQPEQEGPRIQRETPDARVWPEEGATIALQVFLCQRHEFAVTGAQCRADEAAVRKLVIDFLVSRLDDKNAMAIWDLGDRAGSHALSEAAFEYVQRHLQVLFTVLWFLNAVPRQMVCAQYEHARCKHARAHAHEESCQVVTNTNFLRVRVRERACSYCTHTM
jgi:hypothetical protein